MDFENLIYHKPYQLPPTGLNQQYLNSKKEQSINEIATDRVYKENTAFRDGIFINRKSNNEQNFKNRIVNDEDYKSKSKHINHTIDDKSFHKDVIRLTQIAAKTFNGKCNQEKRSGLLAVMKCARKSNVDGSFLKIMTRLLNKYANSVYKFTEEMTEVFLEQIFGENTDLRNNIFDVDKLLGHLRQALHTHTKHENRDVIALSPRQCLTVSLPGCFCKSGFVESSGQCVRPEDCVNDAIYDEYLARVVVT